MGHGVLCSTSRPDVYVGSHLPTCEYACIPPHETNPRVLLQWYLKSEDQIALVQTPFPVGLLQVTVRKDGMQLVFGV